MNGKWSRDKASVSGRNRNERIEQKKSRRNRHPSVRHLGAERADFCNRYRIGQMDFLTERQLFPLSCF